MKKVNVKDFRKKARSSMFDGILNTPVAGIGRKS